MAKIKNTKEIKDEELENVKGGVFIKNFAGSDGGNIFIQSLTKAYAATKKHSTRLLVSVAGLFKGEIRSDIVSNQNEEGKFEMYKDDNQETTNV